VQGPHQQTTLLATSRPSVDTKAFINKQILKAKPLLFAKNVLKLTVKILEPGPKI